MRIPCDHHPTPLPDEISPDAVRARRERAVAADPRSAAGAACEVRYGSFRRGFVLPVHVTAEDVSASYDAGVLAVRACGRRPADPDDDQPAA
jgi:HSP20 family protein